MTFHQSEHTGLTHISITVARIRVQLEQAFYARNNEDIASAADDLTSTELPKQQAIKSDAHKVTDRQAPEGDQL